MTLELLTTSLEKIEWSAVFLWGYLGYILKQKMFNGSLSSVSCISGNLQEFWVRYLFLDFVPKAFKL